MNNEYVVYTLKMARYLTHRGFKYIRTEENPYKPNFVVWVFENSAELRTAITDYSLNL